MCIRDRLKDNVLPEVLPHVIELPTRGMKWGFYGENNLDILVDDPAATADTSLN